MCIEQLHVLNVYGAVACAEMCMEQLHVVKCAWSSCMCMSSEWESIAQLKDTDHTRRYDTKNTLHSVEAVRQVGPGVVSVFVVDTEDDFLVLC